MTKGEGSEPQIDYSEAMPIWLPTGTSKQLPMGPVNQNRHGACQPESPWDLPNGLSSEAKCHLSPMGIQTPFGDSLAHFQANPMNRNPWNIFFGPILTDQLVGFMERTRQVMLNAIEMKIKETLNCPT